MSGLTHRLRAAAAVVGDRRLCRGRGSLALALRRVRGARAASRGGSWRWRRCSLILVDPSLVEEQREPQHDVAAVVVDDSPSMRIGERRAVSPTRRSTQLHAEARSS